METSVLTTKGQLLIPKRIRNHYGFKAGAKVIFEETENGLIIKPMNEQYFRSFKGMLKSDENLLKEIKKMKEGEKKFDERKLNLHDKPSKKNK